MSLTEAEYAQLLANQRAAQGLPHPAARQAAPRPKMNKWECEYDALLRQRYGRGEIEWYGFEAITLKLADDTRYTPDFAVMEHGKLEFHEVKGFWREDALVKFKVAADKFPFLFIALRKQKVSEGGEWQMIRYIKGCA